jgi:hypothetical protein
MNQTVKIVIWKQDGADRIFAGISRLLDTGQNRKRPEGTSQNLCSDFNSGEVPGIRKGEELVIS